MTLSELAIVDEKGNARLRLAGNLPDAVIDGRARPRGQRAAGILLYDAQGHERSGYVTLEPSGNVALTLDAAKRQVAYFVAGREGSSAMQLFSVNGDVLDLRVDEDGPSLHAVRGKGSVPRHLGCLNVLQEQADYFIYDPQLDHVLDLRFGSDLSAVVGEIPVNQTLR